MTTEAIARPRRPVPAWTAYLLDVCIAVFLLAIGPRRNVLEFHGWVRISVVVGLVLPLLLRRRFPVPAFVVIAGVAFLQWLTFGPIPTDGALLVAFYTVAVTSPRRYVIAAAGILELGALLAALRYSPHAEHSLSFFFLSGVVIATGALAWSVRLRRAYLAEVEQRAARLELERDQQAQLAGAAERARVAREMHDIVAHNLSVMIALTDGAALTIAVDPDRASAALDEASRAGRAALTDMRRVLGVLRESDNPTALAPAPGIADLEALLDTVRHTGLEVRYETTGPLTTLEPGVALSAYRIVQEAVTNTLKHAPGAHVIDVSLQVRRDGVQILIRDDGPSTGHDTIGTGHGMIGMRERAAVHRGEVHAGATSRGWLIRAWLQTTTPAIEGQRTMAGA
jgi:signal transduction histidine kinase